MKKMIPPNKNHSYNGQLDMESFDVENCDVDALLAEGWIEIDAAMKEED